MKTLTNQGIWCLPTFKENKLIFAALDIDVPIHPHRAIANIYNTSETARTSVFLINSGAINPRQIKLLIFFSSISNRYGFGYNVNNLILLRKFSEPPH